MNDVQTRVIKLISKHLDRDPSDIKLESKFSDDLGADSLDSVEMIMAFEEEFGVEIPDNEAEKISKVQDIITFIENNAPKD